MCQFLNLFLINILILYPILCRPQQQTQIQILDPEEFEKLLAKHKEGKLITPNTQTSNEISTTPISTLISSFVANPLNISDIPDEPSTTVPNIINKNQQPEQKNCEPYVPPKRDITNTHQRKSVKKCLEYIKEMEIRHEMTIRSRTCPVNETYKYILNGRNTFPGEFPHMVAIGWETVTGTTKFLCGGSLISPKFVLTAAHCKSPGRETSLVDPNPHIVRIGDKRINDQISFTMIQRDIAILSFITHEKYESPKKYYDIALIELVSEVTFTYLIQPACLWPNYDISSLGTKANITGWGIIDTKTKRTSDNLRVATVDIVNNDICDKNLSFFHNRNFDGIQNYHLCAGKKEGLVDACQGDSGGPIQVVIPLSFSTQGQMHYVIAVTSTGFGCGVKYVPGVYTRVSNFIDWIESVVWP